MSLSTFQKNCDFIWFLQQSLLWNLKNLKCNNAFRFDSKKLISSKINLHFKNIGKTLQFLVKYVFEKFGNFVFGLFKFSNKTNSRRRGILEPRWLRSLASYNYERLQRYRSEVQAHLYPKLSFQFRVQGFRLSIRWS